jgi:hypothetical protein
MIILADFLCLAHKVLTPKLWLKLFFVKENAGEACLL